MPMKMDSRVLHTNVTSSVETQTIRIAKLQQNRHTRFGGGPSDFGSEANLCEKNL